MTPANQLLCLLLFLCCAPLAAQPAPLCGGADETVLFDQPADPAAFLRDYRDTWQQLQTSALHGPQPERLMPTYRLPVVIHVVHDCAPLGDPDRNPDEARLKSVLALANQRFRHQHNGADSYTNPLYGPDTEIEICLATEDPNGNFTTGIVRHNDAALARSNDWPTQLAALNSTYGWPNTEYLNLFLVEDANTSGGYFGLGRMLIVTDIYNSGLICHEVGHYLGLAHTFAGSSCLNNDCTVDWDGICDTPPKPVSGFAGANNCGGNNSCTTDDDDTSTNNPYRPVALGGMGDQNDMLPNYMDYTGSCWGAFTVGQKARMIATINANWSSNNAASATKCAPNAVANQLVFDAVSAAPNICTGELEFDFTVRNGGTNTVTSFTVEFMVDGTLVSETFTTSLAPDATAIYTISEPLPAAGNYITDATITAVNGGADAYPGDSETCLSFAVTGAQFPVGSSLNNCSFPGFVTTDSSNDDNFSPGTLTSALAGCIGCHARYFGYNQTAQTAEICLTGLDLSTLNAPALRFTYGHIPRYNFVSNTLSVEFRDCNGGETALWSRSGLALGTNNPPAYEDPGGGGAVPDCSELDDILLTLPTNLTTGDLCFELDGRYFSPLLIDTFEVFDMMSLPLELNSFAGRAAAKTNVLTWSTASEDALIHFLVEATTDPTREFRAVGTVPARNAVHGAEYDFVHRGNEILTTPATYYRLRAVDLDGTERTFGPVLIERAPGDRWSIFPNPAGAGEDLALRGAGGTVEVYSATGRLLATRRVNSGETILAGLELTAGVYVLRMTGENGTDRGVRRVVIR